MRKATVALLVMICGIWLPHHAACMDWIDSNIYGDGLYLEYDTHLAPGMTVDAGGVYVVSSLLLENDADIRGDIYVCGDCNFSIRNSGTVSGKIYPGNDASITQVINGASDMTKLDVDGRYVVLVDGAHDILWTDLVSFGVNAGTVILHDSSVIVTDIVYNEFLTVLDGEITIKLPVDFSVSDNNLLMRNVKGNASVVFDGASPGDLYAYVSYIENDSLYINAVRETDYVKILGAEQGHLLNMIRVMRPDDALLRRLDGAQSMSELHDIMSHSVAFNPEILGRPIRVLNKFMVNSVHTGDYVSTSDVTVSGRPFYIGADDFYMYGGIADISFITAGGFGGGISLYGAIIDTEDEINAFSAGVYGGNIFAKYLKDIWMLRGTVGGAYADFAVPYIFDGGRIHHNAGVMSGYAVADAGIEIGAFTPYVGVGYYGEHVSDTTDTEILGRMGIETKFVLDGEIVEYEYKMTAGINLTGAINAGAAIGFLSPDDMIGGDVAINAMHDEYGFSTMLSVSAKFLF